ncbi:MAG: hypothetical protein R3C59_13770 [Planctomycetaceae bacterium]
MNYRQLDVDKTIDTLKTLQNRISERFDNSSLAGVAGELGDIARETRSRIAWIDRPHMGLRLAVVLVVTAALLLLGFGLNELRKARVDNIGFTDTMSAIEAATNEVIIVGAALLFLFSLEVRVKRTRALRMLHDLRAMAHVIDMHQLTKDPSSILQQGGTTTRSSPKRMLTPFQLTRYLDYCSEMLSLIGKLAALYAQSLPDAVVVAAVNDIETLTNGLSRKIWQKIVILNDAQLPETPPNLPLESSLSPSVPPESEPATS